MKKKLLNDVVIVICIIGALLVFNIVPFIASSMEFESYNTLEFLSLVMFNPIYLIICGVLYGRRFKFSFFFAFILSFCFIPSAFIFFNVSYLFYMFLYMIFIISSQLFGISISEETSKQPQNLLN